jgi:hypothetical protein
MDLVEGSTGPETTQALRNIEAILKACDAAVEIDGIAYKPLS